MSVVTHGGTLPNNTAKTDVYAIVDNATVTSIVNADCSASMGLVDTKLATISTAGKVSGTALTGLASVPSGAGLLPVANITPLLGSWVDCSTGASHDNEVAATDGFVLAYCSEAVDAKTVVLQSYTDTSNPPTTCRQFAGDYVSGGTKTVNLMMPVKKGNRWSVVKTGTGSAAEVVYWIPLGA
jgi:hypothetical protein